MLGDARNSILIQKIKNRVIKLYCLSNATLKQKMQKEITGGQKFWFYIIFRFL